MRTVIAGASLAGVLAFSCLAAAQPTPGTELVVRIKGEPLASGRLQLTVGFGPAVKEGAIIRSEPSHTSLVVVLSPSFAQSARGKDLREDVVASGGALVVSSLPAAEPSVVVQGRPAGDTRVTVGILVDGAEILIADSTVAEGAFGFSSLRDPIRDVTEHCCENPPCPYRCVTCNGPAFTCCGPPNCDIGCRHFNCDD